MNNKLISRIDKKDREMTFLIGIKSTCTVSAIKWLKKNNFKISGPSEGYFIDGILCDYYIVYASYYNISRLAFSKPRWLMDINENKYSYGIEAL